MKFQALSYLVLATQKNILSSYGQSNLRIGASWNCDRRLLRGDATAYWGWAGGGGGLGWGSCVRVLLRDRATASWGWGGGGGAGWGGAVTFASYCVTVRLRAGGDGGVVGSDDDDVDDDDDDDHDHDDDVDDVDDVDDDDDDDYVDICWRC